VEVAPDQPEAPAAMPGRKPRIGARWRPPLLRSAPETWPWWKEGGGPDLLRERPLVVGDGEGAAGSGGNRRRRRQDAARLLRLGGSG
jgi:hypothetical protein